MNNYLIISSAYCDIVEYQVNEYLAKGYAPVGGLSVSYSDKLGIQYTQAIVKPMVLNVSHETTNS